MTVITKKNQIEFGDFQTPSSLTDKICLKLVALGFNPKIVVEPTCGVGTFVISASKYFNAYKIHAYEINEKYLQVLEDKLKINGKLGDLFQLKNANFFEINWKNEFSKQNNPILVIGNFPWVTNSTQSIIGSFNVPKKDNFQHFKGLDAVTGKANFDISEWMLLEILKSLKGKEGDIAMLVKSTVARKILSHCERNNDFVKEAFIIGIDAKRDFNVSVDACLLVIRLTDKPVVNYDYIVFSSLDDNVGNKVGHRENMTISNLSDFEKYSYLFGKSKYKWRSGIKHDLSSVMELTMTETGLVNGYNEFVDIEKDLLYPLLKGSDIGSNKGWRGKFVIVTQQKVGQETDRIKILYPKTWAYLVKYAAKLDLRGSSIYKKKPRFSIFGVGDYTFKNWKIAICSLYKKLAFKLIEPIDNKPVVFDDTVYFISFDSKNEAEMALEFLNSNEVKTYFSSLIFWDDKRPIKTSILNNVCWSDEEKNLHSQCVLFS